MEHVQTEPAARIVASQRADHDDQRRQVVPVQGDKDVHGVIFPEFQGGLDFFQQLQKDAVFHSGIQQTGPAWFLLDQMADNGDGLQRGKLCQRLVPKLVSLHVPHTFVVPQALFLKHGWELTEDLRVYRSGKAVFKGLPRDIWLFFQKTCHVVNGVWFHKNLLRYIKIMFVRC